jgi:4-amino-4-deoxy-L-arabinose transferase-like glycosyltransferase
VVSAAFRVIYFLEANDGPIVHLHRWDESDMSYFDAWARTIAAGDWLSREIRPPLHGWHRDAAAEHARQHPDERRRAASDEDYARALWDRWCGGGRFYQDPLYPYAVALIYKLFGADVRWVFAWQMLLGVVTNVLIYLVARRCFGDAAAVLSALLAMLYGPLMYLEMVLLRESFITFAGLGLTWMVLRMLRRHSRRGWLLIGLAFGLAFALKAIFVLIFFGALASLAVQKRRRGGARRGMVYLCAGALLGFSPVVARNVAVGVEPWMTASGSPPTFIMGNGAEAGPEWWDCKHVGEILDQPGDGLIAALVATLRTHADSASYLRLLWAKFKAIWHWYEIPDNTNFYYYRLHAPALRWMPLTFSIVAPLALLGFIAAFRHRRRCPPLYFLAVTHMLVMLTFLVSDRFRIPFAAALMPFAGLTLTRLTEHAVSGRWKPTLVMIVGVVCLWFAVARPLDVQRPLTRPVDSRIAYKLFYNPPCEAAWKQGDWPKAADILGEALQHQPPEILEMGPSRPARDPQEAELADFYSQLHFAYAELLHRCGREDAAARQYRRAVELGQSSSSQQIPKQP